MEFTRLGGRGAEVSRLAIGTMTFGTQMDEESAHRLLDEAYAAGVNFVDTAELYPAPAQAETYGLAELILGRWLKRVPRNEIIISSKVAGGQRPEGPHLPWVRGGATAVDVAQVCLACDGSLQRLGTDYIDIYQPHWPDRQVPIEVQLEALTRLVEQGKVRRIGLSNETAWGLTVFCAAAREQSRPVCVQNAYNLLQRRVEHGLVEACEREQVSLIAFSPLAMGVLTGKYSGGSRPDRARLCSPNRYSEMYLQERLLAVADAYVAVARAHGIDPAVMAYAWLHQQPVVATILSSFSRLEQLQPFLRSLETRLDPAIMSQLDAVRQTHDARWNMFG
jgi:aryl-alcohol dehydrogenase-like predicted oxidoreductase